jgi:hypothetical protein
MLEDFDTPRGPWWYDPRWDWHPDDRSPRSRRWIWNYDDIREPGGTGPGPSEPEPQARPTLAS